MASALGSKHSKKIWTQTIQHIMTHVAHNNRENMLESPLHKNKTSPARATGSIKSCSIK